MAISKEQANEDLGHNTATNCSKHNCSVILLKLLLCLRQHIIP